MDSHYYAFYIGDFSEIGNSSTQDGIGKCTFKGQELYCYTHESNNSTSGQKFYYSKCRYGRLIIPVNIDISEQQRDYENLNDNFEVTPLEILGKGNYGCIPKFIKNESNNLAFTETLGRKVITLHIARHDMINEQNQTILELEPHFFPISNDDYNKLNNWFTENNYNFNIQGGVDDRSLCDLKVYDPSGNTLLGKINILP